MCSPGFREQERKADNLPKNLRPSSAGKNHFKATKTLGVSMSL